MQRFHLLDGALVVLAVVATTFLGLSYFRPATASPSSPSPPVLAQDLEGTDLPPLRIVNREGGLSSLDLDGEEARIVLVFKSTCIFCERSVPFWRELTTEFGSRLEVVIVNNETVDIAEGWLQKKELGYDRLVVVASPLEVADRWGIRGVPATLLVQGSRVVMAEFGLFDSTKFDRFSESLSAYHR